MVCANGRARLSTWIYSRTFFGQIVASMAWLPTTARGAFVKLWVVPQEQLGKIGAFGALINVVLNIDLLPWGWPVWCSL